ncbi:MAG: hypothetical protein ACP5DQ_05650 [Bacteroidales bacterium]
MRKYKDLRFSEKLLIVMAFLALLGVILKWTEVKEGFFKGWEYFDFRKSEHIVE